MRLYDSHCHLDFAAFDADREAVVERARAAGVETILVPGYEPSQWERLPSLRARFAEVRIAVGVHPHALAGASEPVADMLAERAAALGAVAIGECGLDARTARAGGADWTHQRAVLEAHLAVARELRLPVVLHAVHAHGPLLEALERLGPLRAGGVLHGFTGPAELVPRYAALGLSFGFGAAITRPSARKPKEAARAVPIERLLVETDAPEARAGRRSEPRDVAGVLRALAVLRGEPEAELAERTFENAGSIFGAADRQGRAVC